MTQATRDHQTDAGHERCEIAILGAGIAGLTAAHRLRDRDLVVLEQEPRVGGRTLSGGDDDCWFNVGAQLISNPRLAGLCRDLGIELVSIADADFGFAVNGHFARGRTPERLLANMRVRRTDKLDFAITSLRLRRKLRSVDRMSAAQRAALDRRTLRDVIGRATPTTQALLEACCESASGLAPASISGLYGLAYALGVFLDPLTKQQLHGVRGGTQQIAATIAAGLPDGALRLDATVTAVVRTATGDIAIRYRDPSGAGRTLCAAHCICALPAYVVPTVVEELAADKRTAIASVTPYTSGISVAWEIPDGVPAPWDGVFIAPVAGFDSFNLITNYGYLAQRFDARRGGYLNLVTSESRVVALGDDKQLLGRQQTELTCLFPDAATLLDPERAVIKRWTRATLPRTRPGFLARREALRADQGNLHFCGDYTSEPGLPGANNSGQHAAEIVAGRLSH